MRSVEAARTKGFIAAFHVVRAVVEHELALGDFLKFVQFFVKVHIFYSKIVVCHLQLDKVLLNVRDFFLEFLPFECLCEGIQGRRVGNYPVNYVYHAYQYGTAGRIRQ